MKKLTIFFALLICLIAQTVSAGEIYHRRAVEFRGGLSVYMMMDDPYNWINQITGNTSEEIMYAPDFGFSILYKSHNNFVWNFGYNHLLATRVEYSSFGSDYEELMDANEIYIVPGFIFWPESKLNFSLGAGATLMLASLDRNSPVAGNMSEFYGATGRNLGFLALANIEYLFKPNVAIKIGGGYRSVFIDDINFVSNVSGTEINNQVVWTDGAGTTLTRAYELDFSGVFIEAGIRLYFDPKSKW
ncbi:MAG: hypothetical protein H8E46_04125 [FCB group bacterium]|nr:hypothetical protein [FCB group bacterium]